jgi:hypothetical protein
MFGAIAAVGAGLRVAATAVEDENLSMLHIALCLAVPVACVLVTVFLTWSVLMQAYDLTHVPLFVISLLPLGAAVAVGGSGGGAPVDVSEPAQLTVLAFVVALVALGALLEVIGHEVVGFRHTLRAAGGREQHSDG